MVGEIGEISEGVDKGNRGTEERVYVGARGWRAMCGERVIE